MKEELKYGQNKYISFIMLDIICLIISNYLSILIYTEFGKTNYTFAKYRSILAYMVGVDLFVTFVFNTLRRVLRRRKRTELEQGLKHIGISFVSLSVLLFIFKQGADYSRVSITLSYILYYVLFVGSHILWKSFLKLFLSRHKQDTVILMTTDGFVDEGLSDLQNLNFDVRYIYLLKNLNKNEIQNIPVVKTWEEAAAAICWNYLDKVYIYGLDHQMVPEYLISACKDMKLKFNLVDFNYRIIDIKTIRNKDSRYGELSFLEGKRDLPFPIRRVYWITETEAELHRGFHAHKLNCQLLFCPYGAIDLVLDDGEQRTTVTLDKPGKGLLLMPGLWREMVWQQSGSVLCVLASEYYDADEYIRNYDEFVEYNKNYRRKADPLFADSKK